MNYQQMATFKHLCVIEFYTLFSGFPQAIIDRLCIFGSIIYFNSYLLPLVGVDANFGVISTWGVLITNMLVDAYNGAATMVGDLENCRIIDFEIMLPLNSKMVFLRTVIIRALFMTITSVILAPLSKALLRQRMPLNDFFIGRFLGAVLLYYCRLYALVACFSFLLAWQVTLLKCKESGLA